jgi:hypothetical protein
MTFLFTVVLTLCVLGLCYIDAAPNKYLMATLTIGLPGSAIVTGSQSLANL